MVTSVRNYVSPRGSRRSNERVNYKTPRYRNEALETYRHLKKHSPELDEKEIHVLAVMPGGQFMTNNNKRGSNQLLTPYPPNLNVKMAQLNEMKSSNSVLDKLNKDNILDNIPYQLGKTLYPKTWDQKVNEKRRNAVIKKNMKIKPWKPSKASLRNAEVVKQL